MMVHVQLTSSPETVGKVGLGTRTLSCQAMASTSRYICNFKSILTGMLLCEYTTYYFPSIVNSTPTDRPSSIIEFLLHWVYVKNATYLVFRVQSNDMKTYASHIIKLKQIATHDFVNPLKPHHCQKIQVQRSVQHISR